MAIDRDVLTTALGGGVAGMGIGFAQDRFARNPSAPPWMRYDMAGPNSKLGRLALEHPVATPIVRGLSWALPMALILGALKAGKNFADDSAGQLEKYSSDEREFWDFVRDNHDGLIKECQAHLDNWAEGFVKACEKNNVDPEKTMQKMAQMPYNQPYQPMPQQQQMQPGQPMQPGQAPAAAGDSMPWAVAKGVAGIVPYFIPGVGTVMMAHDAYKDFKNMFAKNKTWKQRLFSGLGGLANTAFAGLSLVPGLGAVGGGLRAAGKGIGLLGKLVRSTPKLGKSLRARQALVRAGNTVTGAGVNLAGRMGQAAQAPGMMGGALRYAGYGPTSRQGMNLARAARFGPAGVAAAPGAATKSLSRVSMYPNFKASIPLGGAAVAGSMYGGGNDPQQAAMQPIKQYATTNPYRFASSGAGMPGRFAMPPGRTF